MLIRGKPKEIEYIGILETLPFNQLLEIIGASKKSKKLAESPSISAKNMQVFTAVIPFEKLFLANSSETMQVQARLTPEVAKVMAKL